MRIVQISTDTIPVPPPKYGGIQRVVHSLTEDLVKMGHEVFLYAPRGSQTSATLIPYEHKGPNNQKIAEYVKRHYHLKLTSSTTILIFQSLIN